MCARGARYGAEPLQLPEQIRTATKFRSDRTYVDGKFLRIPIMPEAAHLYLQQVADNGRKRNLRAVARLTLLPLLASAAFIAFRVTGNDKGIW